MAKSKNNPFSGKNEKLDKLEGSNVKNFIEQIPMAKPTIKEPVSPINIFRLLDKLYLK